MAKAHDTWVNRYARPEGGVYYQAICLCGWYHEDPLTCNDPDKAHELGVKHMADTAPAIPEHQAHVNMGLEWLDMEGARRIVWTPICTCQWMGDRQTDYDDAAALADQHEADPPEKGDDDEDNA